MNKQEAISFVEQLILETPTGEKRSKLTDLNIFLHSDHVQQSIQVKKFEWKPAAQTPGWELIRTFVTTKEQFKSALMKKDAQYIFIQV